MSELWFGFEMETMTFEEHEALVVIPKEADAKRRLAIKTEYWNAFPEAIEIDLVKQGFHLCFIKNNDRWGTQEDLDRKARFIRFVQEKYNLCDTCVPVGMSCGGLFAIKLAGNYPQLISCLYLDAPVVNYYSCPCSFGAAKPFFGGIIELQNALKFKEFYDLFSYRDMPMHHLPTLVKHRIPAVVVTGDSDTVVPYTENGIMLEQDYRAAGIEIEVFTKPGGDHHPHGLEDNTPVLNFILTHS